MEAQLTIQRPVRAELGGYLNAAMLLGSVFIFEGGGAAPADVVLGLALLHALSCVANPQRVMLPAARRATQWLTLTLGLNLALGLATCLIWDGDARALLADTISYAYLLVSLALLCSAAAKRNVRAALVVGLFAATIFSLDAVRDNGMRATGLMANPNMAAAWLGGFAILAFVAPANFGLRGPRIAVAGLCLIATVATGSFSALLGLAVVACYLLATAAHRSAAALLAAGIAVIVVNYWSVFTSNLIEDDRLLTSRGSRTILWEAAWHTWQLHPLGIGYGNFVKDQIVAGGIQTHNDFLSALVENGPLGLVLFLMLGVVLWMSGQRVTRALMVYLAMQAMFHNVVNFRHAWLFLAIALTMDMVAGRERRSIEHKQRLSPGIDSMPSRELVQAHV